MNIATAPSRRLQLNERVIYAMRCQAAGCCAGHEWRISPTPFHFGAEMVKDLESLGRVLLQFNKAVNRLYRLSVEGNQPSWVAQWLDQGKPAELVALQRSSGLKNEWPRVIRPDLLITDSGLGITELDSVPGGIGLTAWLNQAYSSLGMQVVGGAEGMLQGFASIFGDAPNVHLVISEESATYVRRWPGWQINWVTHDLKFSHLLLISAMKAMRFISFFELFDAANVPGST